jgi:hypothetical protein
MCCQATEEIFWNNVLTFSSRGPHNFTAMKSPLKQPTTATCFSSFMLPHVLFVRSFEERQKAAMSCCLGWNISLFPDALQRKQQIDRVWDRVEADNQEPAPPGLEQGFKQDLRMLTTQKQNLFPWLNTNIPRAELSQSDTHDILSIKTGHSGIEEIRLVTHPDPLGLPLIIEVLRGIQRGQIPTKVRKVPQEFA